MAVRRVMIPISFQYEAVDGDLIPIPVASPVTIVNRDSLAPATVYVSETGPDTIPAPQTDAGGNIGGWLEQGSYLFSTATNGSATPPYAGATLAWEAVRGDGVENYAPGSVSSAALAAGSVTSAALDATLATIMATQVFMPGDLKASAAVSPPSGWLLCDGSSKLRSSYTALFGAISTAYGSVDGTHFNVPDFRGRALLGAGGGTGLSARNLGDKDGFENHQLTISQMPSHSHGGSSSGVDAPDHSHGVSDPGHQHYMTNNPGIQGFVLPIAASTNVNLWQFFRVQTSGTGNVGVAGVGTWPVVASASTSATEIRGTGITGTGGASARHAHSVTVASQGSDGVHNNMQPFGVANMFIKI